PDPAGLAEGERDLADCARKRSDRSRRSARPVARPARPHRALGRTRRRASAGRPAAAAGNRARHSLCRRARPGVALAPTILLRAQLLRARATGTRAKTPRVPPASTRVLRRARDTRVP